MKRLILIAFAACLTTPAAAHRQPEVETTVEVVAEAESEGGGEVMHLTTRLHAHDALAALRALGEAKPELGAPKQRARLALYAADRLEVAGDAKTRVIGAETEGNYLFVYLIHPEVAAIEGSSVLAEVSPGWSNTVHLKADGETIRSVTFSEGTPRADEPLVPARAAARPAFTETH